MRLQVFDPNGTEIGNTGWTTFVEQSGIWNVPFDFNCRTEGAYRVSVLAISCSYTPDRMTTAETTVAVRSRPTIGIVATKIENQANPPEFLVYANYTFPEGPGSRRVVLKQNETVIVDFVPETASGTTPSATVKGCGEIIGTATFCNKVTPDFQAMDTRRMYVDACENPKYSCEVSPGGPPNTAADPINFGSGDVHTTVPLFTIDQPGEPLSVALHYHSSRALYPSLANEMSPGWTHTFSETLRPLDDTAEYLFRVTATGEDTVYHRLGTGDTWLAIRPRSLHDRVTRVGNEYRLESDTGEHRAFDVSTGRWVRTVDRWGNAVTAQYGATGNLESVTDALGRVITISSTGATLHQITLPGGARWQFTYSGGNLRSIRDPQHTSGHWRLFDYVNDPAGVPRLLIYVRDEGYAYLEAYQYDAVGRGTVTHSGSRRRVTIEYDTPAPGKRRVTHAIDSGINQVSEITVAVEQGAYYPTLTAGGCLSCGGFSDAETREYDQTGLLTRRVDARGTVTTYSYDGRGNLLSITEAEGTPLARTTTYSYGSGRFADTAVRTTRTGPAGSSVVEEHTWAADGTSVTTTITGRDPESASSLTYTTVRTFDSRHRPLTVDGPRTDVADITTMSYYADDDADVFRRGRLRSTTTGPLVTTLEDYDIYGTPRRVIDPNGVITDRTTDGRGRIASETVRGVASDPDESADLTIRTIYDGRDRVVEQVSAAARRTRYTYENGTNSLVSTVRLDTAGMEIERLFRTFNAGGLPVREDLQSCATPATTCTSWVTRHSTSFAYDNQGRLREVRHPDKTFTSYTYDGNGNLTGVKDENSTVVNTTYTYDVLNQLRTVAQTLGTGSVTMSYGYDLAGNLTEVKDPNGNVTTYEYDDFGRLQRQLSPVTGETAYSYDAAGNLISTIDATGATTTRTYDALNRPLSATAVRSSSTEAITWTYDEATAGVYGVGRLTSMSDPSGSTTFAYDRRGLLRRESRTLEGVTYTTGYGYDADANRTRITYPDGREVVFGYDYASRPITATFGATTLVSSATYLPFGPLTKLVYGNGTQRDTAYDQRYRVTNHKLTGPAGLLASHDYTYDAVGNITAIADALSPGYSRTFAYDKLHRLITASTGSDLWGTGGYTYDAMGNILTATLGTAASRTFSYDGTTPRLTSVSENGAVRTVDYDAAGNETAVGGEVFAYTPRNLLRGHDSGSYDYDGRGVRVITRPGTAGAMLYAASEPGVLPPPMTSAAEDDSAEQGPTEQRSQETLWSRIRRWLRRGPPAPPFAIAFQPLAQTGGGLRRYSFYTPELQLLGETSMATASGPPLEWVYVWFNGEPLAQIETATGAIHYYFNDHLGAPRLTTDATGAVDWQVEREPYGRVFSVRAGASRHQPLGLPGQEQDATNAELQYNIFRWYRAGWGRYTQVDPASKSFAVDLHPYGYVRGNPTTLIDPLGLLEIRPSCGNFASVIHRAVRDAARQTRSCLTCGTQWPRLRDALVNMTIDCVSNDQVNGKCAESTRGGRVMLNLRNFLATPPGGCPCLAGLLAHEAGHIAFWHEQTDYEGIAWRIERNCFPGCGQPWPAGTKMSLD